MSKKRITGKRLHAGYNKHLGSMGGYTIPWNSLGDRKREAWRRLAYDLRQEVAALLRKSR